MAIEQLVSLTDAARRMGISADLLKQHIKDGTIRASKLPDGEMAVPESEIPKITRQQFEHLRCIPITITDASKKYNLVRNTLLEWVKKGYLSVLKPGYRMEVDESDVAFCATVYKRQNGGQGKRILDDVGRPYKLKNPTGAQYRREYRMRKKVKQNGGK